MKTRLLVACLVLLSLTAGQLPSVGAVQSPAATPRPPDPPHTLRQPAQAVRPERETGPNGPQEPFGGPGITGREGLRAVPAGQAPVVAPESTGGPDEFGYTWDDSVDLDWIDASGGTDTGLGDGTSHVGPIDTGFPFKYYENSYSQLFVSLYGFVGFDEAGIDDAQARIPASALPNNVIAPHWAPADHADGYIRYLSGGTAPERWFVVEWNHLRGWDEEDYTFEVILHENGDVTFQYLEMEIPYGYYCQASGIEDSTGLDGLSVTGFCAPVAGNHAVGIYRPEPSARVRISPSFQGRLTQPGTEEAFQVQVRNWGDLGADIYDLAVASGWAVSLFAEDGVTPLTDTDSDGVVDTGPVAQGDTFIVVASLAVPDGAAVGDHDAAALIATSSLDPAKSRTATLQAAVPAPFAQVYDDYADGAMSLELVQPAGDVVRKAAGDWTYGYYPAVAETPGGFAYVWSDWFYNDPVYGYELWYALFDRYGQEVRAATKLTDHSGATVNTYDYYPAVASTPDGRIGVLWYTYQYDQTSGLANYNIYFAILDASGTLVYGPLSVTANDDWGEWGDYYWPSFYSPSLAATADNRFVLGWEEEYQAPPEGSCTSYCTVENVYYAVRSSAGAEVKPVTQFTFDTPGEYTEAYYPNLAALSGSRALLSWTQNETDDVHYAVLDSAGNVVKDRTNLVGDGWYGYDYQPDAVQLSGGRTLVAWYTYGLDNPGEQGWTGTYYNNETLTPPAALERPDDRIDFDWGLDSPDPLVNPDYFSARWLGTIEVSAGTYTFQMGSDDGSLLRIDGEIVMEHWYECCTYWTADVELTAGTHQVQMDMHEHDGAAWARLYWWPQNQVPIIRYALLDGDYDRVFGPAVLDNPAAATGSAYVSAAADTADHAILTCMDYDSNSRSHLYYALVDGSGAVTTPPIVFHTSPSTDNPRVYTSYSGFGNTSWSWQAPAEVDGYAAFGATAGGPPGGGAMLEVKCGNHGATTAHNVELTATLDPALTYLWDTSGIAPVVVGNEVTWSLPNQAFLDAGSFLLYVGIPAGALIGTTYPVEVEYVSDGPEANPPDNTDYAEVMAALQLFLPFVLRAE